jgi:hypothetical protein
MPRRERDNQVAMNRRPRTPRHDQAAIQGVRECCDGPLDFVGIAHSDRAHLHLNRRRHGLDYCQLTDPGSCGGIPKHCRSLQLRRDLLSSSSHFALTP